MFVPTHQVHDQWWVFRPGWGWANVSLEAAVVANRAFDGDPAYYEGWKLLCGACPVRDLTKTNPANPNFYLE